MEAILEKIRKARQPPKDAKVITSILREAGCEDFDPRVVNQLLEFTYRYVSTILDDAKTLADHAGKPGHADLEDVKLASKLLHEKSFKETPSRHVLDKLTKETNSKPLPIPTGDPVFRLPLDRHCLLAPNFRRRDKPVVRMRAPPKPKPKPTTSVVYLK